MKRQVQYAGVKKWAGSDIVECQSQPLEAIDRFFGQYGPHILQGCEVTLAGDRADISAGLAALEGKDAEGNDVRMVVPFEGVTGTVLPVYLTLSHTVRERPYVDGSVKPVAYDYKAVASSVKPAGGTSYLEITAAGGVRFADAVQDAGHRFVTDRERAAWDAKETPDGAQEKADSAEEQAVRDAVLGRQITSAVMGKGLFKSSAPALTTDLKEKPHTTVILFTTPSAEEVGMKGVYGEGPDATTGFGTFIWCSGGNVVVSIRGGNYKTTKVPPQTLCMAALSYRNDRAIMAINGSISVAENPPYPYLHNPQRVLVGGTERDSTNGRLCTFRVVSVRKFNFAATADQLTEMWNGGHPELWTVPDRWRDAEGTDRVLLDLSPAGLTPTRWYDASGAGNDLPYVPSGINPDGVELSESLDGFPTTTAADRERLLHYATGYTKGREELLLRLAAEAADRGDAALKRYADEVGNTALDAAAAYTDEQLGEKQDKVANITITDFDAFNPSAVAELRELPDGGFVTFSSYDAIGRPDTANSTSAKICTGRITRLRSGYYRLEAMCGTSSPTTPQAYTRMYVSGQAQPWQAATETFNYGTDGSVQLPSGLMIQWGRHSPNKILPVNITFPKPFGTYPLGVSLTRIDGDLTQEIWTLTVRSLSETRMEVIPTRLTDTGEAEAGDCPFFWMAIGRSR